jgi:hypothetical protein
MIASFRECAPSGLRSSRGVTLETAVRQGVFHLVKITDRRDIGRVIGYDARAVLEFRGNGACWASRSLRQRSLDATQDYTSPTFK